MSAQHTPGAKLRKPTAREQRGLANIRTEMQTIAEDMSTYKSREERQRGRDILAGLEYIKAAIAQATGSQS
jgi:hypothetical protein